MPVPQVAMCLNAGAMGRRDAETETLIPTIGAVFDDALDTMHTLRGEGFDASEDGTGRGTPQVPVAMLNMMGAKGMAAFEENPETSYTLTQGCQSGADMHAICFYAKDHGADAVDDCSPTLRAGGFTDSHQNGGVMPAVAYAIQERAVSENLDNGPQGKGFQEGVAYTLEVRNKVQATAFALRGREGGAMPEVEGDQVGALRAASGGPSRSYVATTAARRTLEARTVPQAVAYGMSTYETPKFAEELQPTLTVPSSSGGGQPPATVYGSAVRRLTPRECERLQGFPDYYTAIPWRKKPADQCPDGPRYKALGNSMAVPCMRWLGERIAEVERLIKEGGDV